MKFIAFTLLLSLAAVASCADYDYLVLATEWAGTVCKEQACNQAMGINPNFFNIHGLWPNSLNRSADISFCSKTNVQAHKYLLNLRNDLRAYWSGLYSELDRFHSYQWSKHGSCWSNQTSTINSYFKTGLNLAQKYNAFSILQKGGLIPGNTYPLNTVFNVLSKGYGVNKFGLYCSNGNLKEIRICFNKGGSIINCPWIYTNSCPANVAYPALKL
mmetsp:Transcript_26202/g.30384  ORF Transcript_26202/g.30384 Transcript_26202/m.30384 type:complete len:215 (-) Transcript_26202:117-761(-)